MARSKRCLSCVYCKNFRNGPGLYNDNVELTDREIVNYFFCDHLCMTGKKANKEPGKKSCKSYKKMTDEDMKKIKGMFASGNYSDYKED